MNKQANSVPSRPVYQSPIVINIKWDKTIGLTEFHEHNNLLTAKDAILASVVEQLWCGPGEKLTHEINWHGTPYDDQNDGTPATFKFAVIGIRNENDDGTRLFVDAILTSPLTPPGPIIIERHPDDDQCRYEPDGSEILTGAQIALFIDTDAKMGAILAYGQDNYGVNLTPDPSLKIDFEHIPTPAFLRPVIKIADLPIKWPKTEAPKTETHKAATSDDPDDD